MAKSARHQSRLELLQGTLAGTRLLSSFLFGITATDPGILAGAAVALVVTGLGAASFPAWRGAQRDPMEALREE